MLERSLSVVVPIFNGAMYFEEAIESILNQADNPFDSLEIIAVDDGSSDETLVLLTHLAAQISELKVVSLAQNLGPAASRNAGIAVATGEWLAFLDHDDCWSPDKLSKQFAFLEKHSQYDFALSHCDMFIDERCAQPKWLKPKWLDAPQPANSFSTLLIKRQTFLSVGLLDSRITKGGEDVDWFLKARACGLNHYMMPEVFFSRRVHAQNLSQKTASTSEELLKIVRAELARKTEFQPRFSVIMPAYNAEKTILFALQSVLSQLGEQDEVIVVDDGSTDQTVAVLEQIDDQRLKYLSLAKNSGISAARNQALPVCQGHYIAFLDADDWWPEGSHALVRSAIRTDRPDLLSGMVSHEYCDTLNPSQRAEYRLPVDQHASLAGSVVVNQAAAAKAGLFDETLKTGEFIDWYLRVKKHTKKTLKLDQVILKRRIHANNYTLQNRGQQTDYLKIVRQHLRQADHAD